MKKFFIILLALTALFSCEKKESSQDTSDISPIQQETLQPDPYSVNTNRANQTITYTSAATSEIQTTENISNTTTTEFQSEETTVNTFSTTIKQNSQQQPDPLGGGAFSYNEDGAVQFEQDTDDEQVIISAAQALFESACRTQWDFTVGCLYEIDTNSIIKNDFGWSYYKITDENIKTLADVEKDYYSIFSERYPNQDSNKRRNISPASPDLERSENGS